MGAHHYGVFISAPTDVLVVTIYMGTDWKANAKNRVAGLSNVALDCPEDPKTGVRGGYRRTSLNKSHKTDLFGI